MTTQEKILQLETEITRLKKRISDISLLDIVDYPLDAHAVKIIREIVRPYLAGGRSNLIGQVEGTKTDLVVDGSNRALGGLDLSGNLIKEIINTRLNTSTQEILANFTFGTSGAIRIPGFGAAGIWISPAGIFGANTGGIATFSISAFDGSAVFRGEVSAGSLISADISAERITAGTLTGRTVQTKASGARVVMGGGADWIKFFDAAAEQVTLFASGGDFLILGSQTTSDIFLNAGSSGNVGFAIGGSLITAILPTGFIPSGTRDLGNSFNRWRDLFISGRINLTAVSWHSWSAGDIINWSSGGIDQFRGRPGTGTWIGSFDMTAV